MYMFTVKQPRHFLFSCMVASQSSIFMNWKSLQQNHKNYPFKILANFTDLAKCFRTLWLYCGAHHFCVIHFKLFLLRPDGHYGCDYHQFLSFHSFFFLFLLKRFCHQFLYFFSQHMSHFNSLHNIP